MGLGLARGWRAGGRKGVGWAGGRGGSELIGGRWLGLCWAELSWAGGWGRSVLGYSGWADLLSPKTELVCTKTGSWLANSNEQFLFASKANPKQVNP